MPRATGSIRQPEHPGYPDCSENRKFMLNTAILGIGSNDGQEEHFRSAEKRLRELFPDIRFSDPVYTEPENCPNPALFLNRVAVFRTVLPQMKIEQLLKRTEFLLGRRPENKKQGRIPIDIDLIRWNDCILKPDDLQRTYILDGIRSLLADDGSFRF